MKVYKLLAIFSFVFYIIIQADTSISIKELLSQIAKAPDKDKRVLINKLKLQLQTLNEEVRKKTMIEVKNSIHNINHNHHHHHNDIEFHRSNHQPKFRELHNDIVIEHNEQNHNKGGR